MYERSGSNPTPISLFELQVMNRFFLVIVAAGTAAQKRGDLCPIADVRVRNCDGCSDTCVVESLMSHRMVGAKPWYNCGCDESPASDKKRGDLCPIDGDIPVTKDCDACADNCIIDGIMQNKMKGSRPMRYHCKCGDGETAGPSPAPKLRCHVVVD